MQLQGQQRHGVKGQAVGTDGLIGGRRGFHSKLRVKDWEQDWLQNMN